MATTKTRKAPKRKQANVRFVESKGLYELRFTVSGSRFSVYGATVAECREKETKKREALAQGIQTGNTQTFEKYADKWLDNLSGSVSSSTVFTYRGKIASICAVKVCGGSVAFGSLKLKDITSDDCRELQTELHRTLSAYNTNQIMSRGKAVMESAVDDRLITWNPFTRVRSLKRTEQEITETVHRGLSKPETQRLLDTAKSEKYYYNLIKFFLNTGLRCGEVGALRYSDVDLKNNILHVKRTLTRAETGEFMIGTTTKTYSGTRDIPLNAESIAAIRWQMEYNKTQNTGKVTRLNDLLFVSLDFNLLNVNTVNNALKRICKAAGIERLTVHGLRDTFATRCAESGMAPRVLMELMGHSSIEVTMNIYVHVMDDTKTAELNAVNFC